MKKLLSIILAIAFSSHADTPPPNSVKAKVYDGTGTTAIGNVGDSLKVNVTNSGGSSTVNQGTQGSALSPWWVYLTNSSIPVTQSGVWSTGRTWTLLNSTDSVDVGNFPSTYAVTQSTSPWVVSASSLPLPSGAATSALQSSGNASLTSIDSKIPSNLTVTSTRLLVDGSGVTQPISAAALPLPSGASTSANQTTANASLSSIDSKLTSPIAVSQSGTWNVGLSTGSNTIGKVDQGTGGISAWKVDGSAVTQPVSAVSLPLPTGAATSANQTTGNSSLSSIDGKLNSLGQKAMAASVPVVIASDQSTVTVTGTVTATNSANGNTGSAVPAQATQIAGSDGTNLRAVKVSSTGVVSVDGSAVTQPVSGTVTANQGGTWNINNISGTVTLPTLASTSTKQSDGSQKTQIVDGSNATVGPVTTISSVNYMPVILPASATTGSAVPARSVLVSGSDGTNARNLSTDTSGRLNVNSVGRDGPAGGQLVRNVYSTTNVTTAAYVQLIASTTNVTNHLFIFDSSGQTLFLATGAAASEVNKYYIVPGGNGLIDLNIPAGTRISVKAVSATASSGELSITLLQ